MDQKRPPRPPRSLRDRSSVKPLPKVPETKEVDSNSYLDSLESSNEDELENLDNFIDDDFGGGFDDDFDDEPFEEVQVTSHEVEKKSEALEKASKTSNFVKTKKTNQNKEKKKEKKNPSGTTQNLEKPDLSNEVNKFKSGIEEVEEEFSETGQGIKQISSKVIENVNNVKNKVLAVSMVFATKALKGPKNLLNSLFFKKKKKSNTIESEEKKPEKVKVSLKHIPKIKYSTLIKKNINFLAYDKQSIVDKDMSNEVIDELFMANAISDIKYCQKYVKDLPSAKSGPYKDLSISETFSDIKTEDINLFLFYIKNNIEAFKDTNYKLSEAFATWMIRKSNETYKESLK